MIVISGGQTGADQAGLFAARDCNIKTGGFAPNGWRIIGGRNKEVLEGFGLIEHPSPKYKDRTAANVELSDVTFRLAFDFKSHGEICTLNAIKKYEKHHVDFDLNKQLLDPFIVAQLLIDKKVEILNIAGNGDGPHNGLVFNLVYVYLCNVFSEWNKKC